MEMEIEFLGVGEACDPTCYNTALLVAAGRGATRQYILLDCGFTTPHRYFLCRHDPDQLAAVWISHFHGDHFLGIPLLLLRFWEMGRTRPLLLLGPSGVGGKVEQAVKLAYPFFRQRLRYPLRYIEVGSDTELVEAGCRWHFAAMEHAQPSLGVHLAADGVSLFYSGDGRATVASRFLAEGCHCLVHEAYGLEEAPPNHGTVAQCLSLAAESGCRRLALVHVGHAARTRLMSELPAMVERAGLKGKVFLPEPGEVWRL